MGKMRMIRDAHGTVDGFCLVKSAAVRIDSKGSEYLDMVLADSDGECVAKLWSYSRIAHGEYEMNDIVKVRGGLQRFKDTEQFRIDRIRKQQTVTHRGELSIAYENARTKDLLAYFQANQDCIVTGVLLNEKTDYKKLNETASVALVKDEAVIGKLLEAGWTETADFTDAQKEANAKMFNFTVLNAPSMTASGKESAKLLTDWLAGDGVYEKTLTSTSGCGCSCSKEEKVVKFKSDAPKLFESGQFQDLMDN